MTAGSVAMRMFDQLAVMKLNQLGDTARTTITEAINTAGVPACVTGQVSMFRIHLRETAPTSYRAGFVSPDEQPRIAALLDHLFGKGLRMIETCTGFLSIALTTHEIDQLGQTVPDGVRKITPMS